MEALEVAKTSLAEQDGDLIGIDNILVCTGHEGEALPARCTLRSLPTMFRAVHRFQFGESSSVMSTGTGVLSRKKGTSWN
jgi:hypothetical protein